MNRWSVPYSASTNFTIDNTVESYDYNFLRDFVVCTFVFLMLGNFLEGFAEHLRRPRNNDDNHLGFDILDYMMFFD